MWEADCHWSYTKETYSKLKALADWWNIMRRTASHFTFVVNCIYPRRGAKSEGRGDMKNRGRGKKTTRCGQTMYFAKLVVFTAVTALHSWLKKKSFCREWELLMPDLENSCVRVISAINLSHLSILSSRRTCFSSRKSTGRQKMAVPNAQLYIW